MKVHHIGYLVASIQKAETAFKILGYENYGNVFYDKTRKIDICFMKNEDTLIELIAPRENCTLFTSLAKKIGNAPYHICYIAEDILLETKKLQNRGWTTISALEVADAIGGRRVVFLFHNDIGMIELLEMTS